MTDDRLSTIPFGWVEVEDEEEELRDLPADVRSRASEWLQAADVVDSELRSYIDSQSARGVRKGLWGLLHDAEGGVPTLLYTFNAFSKLDARYWVLCHCSAPGLPRGAFPRDYHLCALKIMRTLLEPSGRLADIMPNFVAMDLGDYRLVRVAGYEEGARARLDALCRAPRAGEELVEYEDEAATTAGAEADYLAEAEAAEDEREARARVREPGAARVGQARRNRSHSPASSPRSLASPHHDPPPRAHAASPSPPLTAADADDMLRQTLSLLHSVAFIDAEPQQTGPPL